VSDGCVTLHLSAALVKFSSLAVARKYLTCCISIAAVYHSFTKKVRKTGGDALVIKFIPPRPVLSWT